MADVIESVVLKIALELENSRLERLDTTLARRSVDELEKYANDSISRIRSSYAAASQAAAAQSASFSQRFSTAGQGGGNRGGSDLGFGDLGQASQLINRYSAGLDEAQRRLAQVEGMTQRTTASQRAFGQRLYESVAQTKQANEATQQLNQQSQELESRNLRVANAFGKVGTASAVALVAYRALTQVNGEHVNALGAHEQAVERSLIGLATLGHTVKAGAGVFQALGVSVGVASAALYAIPVAAVAYGIHELAKAQAEYNRQSEIQSALQEKVAALSRAASRERVNEAMRLREEKELLEQKTKAGEFDRFQRGESATSKKLGLTADPAERKKQLDDELKRINEAIKSRDSSNFIITTSEGEIERLKEAIALQQRKTEIIEAQRRAVMEMEAGYRQNIDTLYRDQEQKNQLAQRLAGMSLLERAKAKSLGTLVDQADPQQEREVREAREKLVLAGADPSKLNSLAGLDSLRSELGENAKSIIDRLIAQQKEQIDKEAEQAATLEELDAAREAHDEAFQKFLERELESYRKRTAEMNAVNEKLGQLGSASQRRI